MGFWTFLDISLCPPSTSPLQYQPDPPPVGNITKKGRVQNLRGTLQNLQGPLQNLRGT